MILIYDLVENSWVVSRSSLASVDYNMDTAAISVIPCGFVCFGL